jgi:hypothetical protein
MLQCNNKRLALLLQITHIGFMGAWAGHEPAFPIERDWLRQFSPFPVCGERRESPVDMRFAGTTAQPCRG